MSIKKRFCIVLIILMSTVLICSYSITFMLFKNTMISEVISYQESIVSLNKNLMSSFMDSIEQTALRLISDQTIGTYLSNTSSDPLTRIQTSSAIHKQFSQYATTQIPNRFNYYYKNTLFLNDTLPITSAFECKTLDTNSYNRSCNVFSNHDVKKEYWYLKTLQSPRNHYVFINEASNEFCFAKKIQNTFYLGPYDSNGIGVMVISIKLDQLESLLTFSPLTPNSGYCLVSKEGDILYKSNDTLSSNTFLDLYTTSLSSKNHSSKSILATSNDQKYFFNTSSLDWGLSIIFLTPYADILAQSTSFMHNFIKFGVCVILLMPPLAYLIASKITKPIINLSCTIQSIDDTRNFDIERLNFAKDLELNILCNSFKQLIRYVNNLIHDVQVQGEKQKEVELQALQAQINPHFIFNAMDVVNWIALSRNQDDLANIVNSISNLMRYSITNPNHPTKISNEIENIYEFISIHQLRHEYPIILNVDTKLPLHTLLIPKFTIQPLVENAIKHGIDYEKGIDKLIIKLFIYSDEQHLYIEASSNGKVCDPSLLNDYLQYKPTSLAPSNGFGIRNVNERIKLYFKDESRLYYTLNEKGQLLAKIILPHLK